MLFYAIATLALLFATQAESGVRYNIVNNITGKTFSQDFRNDTKGEAWKQKQIAKNSWGRAEHNIFYRNGEQQKVNALNCDDVMQIDFEALPEPIEVKVGERCFYAQEYSIVETDVTQDIIDADAEKEADKKEMKDIKKMKGWLNEDPDVTTTVGDVKKIKRILKRILKSQGD